MCWECLGYDEEAKVGGSGAPGITHTHTHKTLEFQKSTLLSGFVCKCVNMAQTWYRLQILELAAGERFSAPCWLGVSGSLLEWLSALVTMKTLLSGGVNLSPSSFCECERIILKRYPPIQIAVVMASTNVRWCHHLKNNLYDIATFIFNRSVVREGPLCVAKCHNFSSSLTNVSQSTYK